MTLSSAPRIVLFGPMGIGKSTAIRTLCGELAVDCDVPNLDLATSAKETTTVGADYGVIHLAEGQELHIYGSPGQERFAFMREWLMSLAIGAVILVDLADHGALDSALTLIREAEASATSPVVAVVVARPASEEQIQAFAQTLSTHADAPVPVLSADVRDREQMLDVLSLLFSMISVELEEPSEDASHVD